MKIYIDKFGPIEDAVVEFAPLVVFSGDSNLGKSYTNYLFYYVIRSLTHIDEDSFISKKIGKKDNVCISLRMVRQMLENKAEPFMRSFLNAPDIECKVRFELLPNEDDRMYNITFSQDSVSKNNEDSISRDLSSITVHINDYSGTRVYPSSFSGYHFFFIQSFFSSVLMEEILGKKISMAYILPPARGAFVGENYTLKDRISSSVGMYKLFLEDYDAATQIYSTIQKGTRNKYFRKIEKLINGKLITREGKQYLLLRTGYEIPLSAAASSIKELSPFLYSLQNSPSNLCSFCIEEPEAHLHPKMQVEVTDLIANCINEGMLFQCTTHSDYVMQRVNQLIKLNYIKNNNKDAYDTICSNYNLGDAECLDANMIKAYFFDVDESGKVAIEQLRATEKGFPMLTFFDIAKNMTNLEFDLDESMNN